MYPSVIDYQLLNCFVHLIKSAGHMHSHIYTEPYDKVKRKKTTTLTTQILGDRSARNAGKFSHEIENKTCANWLQFT
jgi:hypothetical protein